MKIETGLCQSVVTKIKTKYKARCLNELSNTHSMMKVKSVARLQGKVLRNAFSILDRKVDKLLKRQL